MRKAFKLCRIKDGKVFPLYVLANKEIKMNEWNESEEGISADDTHVKSKLGNLRKRSGWHCCLGAWCHHIGGKVNKNDKLPSYRKADEVWIECLIRDDVDYTEEAKKYGRNGMLSVPKDGFYMFKTSGNVKGDWLITSAIKPLRILTDEEVYELNKQEGIFDLPREQ